MVVLMAFLPTHYALNENFNPEKAVRSLDRIEAVLVKAAPDNILEKEMYKSIQIIEDLRHDIRENLNSTEKPRNSR